MFVFMIRYGLLFVKIINMFYFGWDILLKIIEYGKVEV